MNSTQLSRLPLCAYQSVAAADKSGALDRGEYTMAMARRDVIRRLGLREKAAGEKDVKDAVKQAINDALAAAEDGDVEEEDAAEEGEKEEADIPSSDEEFEEEPARKKAKRASSSHSRTSTPASKTGRGSVKARASAKSAATIEDSDDEEVEKVEEPAPKKRTAISRSRISTLAKGGSKAHASAKSVETIEASDDDDAAGSRPVASGSKIKKRATSDPPSAERSESEMSSVYDEPPAKKSGRASISEKKTKKTTKTTKTKKAKKDANEGLSPDEARVADLKRIVVGCGVRKQWTKELADAPTPKSQISHLLSLLQSLGMKGSPSMGKAKGLKERRELAQELSDVKEFGAAQGAERPRRSRGAPDAERSEAKDGAMAAVMDFLSDDDDD